MIKDGKLNDYSNNELKKYDVYKLIPNVSSDQMFICYSLFYRLIVFYVHYNNLIKLKVKYIPCIANQQNRHIRIKKYAYICHTPKSLASLLFRTE